MSIVVIALIISSSLLNMYADVLLVSGRNFKIVDENPATIAKKTPDNHMFKSGIIGAFSISIWMSMLYFFSQIEGIVGDVTMISFAMFVGAIMVFHVICSKIFLMTKHTEIPEKELYKIMTFYIGLCVMTSIIFTALMIFLGLTGQLDMHWYHYVTLPIFATGVIQFALPKIIRIKHFNSISGTISILVSMLFMISIFI